MNSATSADRSALIKLILERYHEPHREDLARLRKLAEELANADLEADVVALHELLELHMFKEEMRAFPMIEQGSSGLMGHLAADMMEEHERVEALSAQLQQRIFALPRDGAGSSLSELNAVATRFFSDLAEHARLEDDRLFRPLLTHPINTVVV